MAAFGEYIQQSPTVEPGIYDAIIESATVVNDPQTGSPKINDNGKHQVDVLFRIDRETSLNRRFTISFGKNKQTGQYAAFASFITAATGIPHGDPRQRTVTEDDLRAKRVRIVTVVTEEGYVNIDSIAPPAKAKAKPVDDLILEDIPF